jgi:hypothetical protein
MLAPITSIVLGVGMISEPAAKAVAGDKSMQVNGRPVAVEQLQFLGVAQPYKARVDNPAKLGAIVKNLTRRQDPMRDRRIGTLTSSYSRSDCGLSAPSATVRSALNVALLAGILDRPVSTSMTGKRSRTVIRRWGGMAAVSWAGTTSPPAAQRAEPGADEIIALSSTPDAPPAAHFRKEVLDFSLSRN